MHPDDSAAVLDRHRNLFSDSPLQRASALAAPFGVAGLAIFAVWRLSIPFSQIGPGLASLGKFIALMFPPSTGGHLDLLLKAMGETLAIAFLGTLIAGGVSGQLFRREEYRASPDHSICDPPRPRHHSRHRCLVLGPRLHGVVGLGSLAEILAIAVSDTGALGKLFSEAIESAEERARKSVLASGGTGLLAMRFGLLPQVLPIIAGQILYYFESNVRSATIIGIVGAGGIGLQLSEQIRTYDFDQVAFAVIMILVTVSDH